MTLVSAMSGVISELTNLRPSETAPPSLYCRACLPLPPSPSQRSLKRQFAPFAPPDARLAIIGAALDASGTMSRRSPADGTTGSRDVSVSRSILVLFGSETGNSQEFAEDLDRCAQRLHFQSRVCEMDSVQLSTLLQYSLVVFKLLRRKLAPGSLASLQFTTFGLGDSSYPKFNWAARKLVRRLDQLGALEVFPSGEADERHPDGTDGLYLRWAPIPEDVPLPSRFPLQFCAVESPTTTAVSEPANYPRSLPVLGSRVASVASNGRITAPDHFQDVRLLTLDLPTEQDGSSLELNPGDTITVFPSNHLEEAQALIQFMGWEQVADAPIDWPACTRPPALHVDDTFTLRDLLVHNLDITAVPRRSFLHKIAYFASDPDQRSASSSSPAPSAPERALDTFPMIRGREFSIANGGDALRHPTDPTLQRVELVVALVRYKTILRKERRGLCSRYLDGLAPGASIPVLHKDWSALSHFLTVHFAESRPSPPSADQNQPTNAPPGPSQRRYVQDVIGSEPAIIADMIHRGAIFLVCGGSHKMAEAVKTAVLAAIESVMGVHEPSERDKVFEGINWVQEIW
ncbi:unnamed protein product [Parascedosporium putredinis]|uniref:FAD-binding FR-type domain-containing protein n=1 Tax=Parascedosporium putredinis TaxID=1442378 RepID=A0A9P1GUU5_9PEZI|nr:unnamed protein product [Parascedosporium putredinis]CAI7987756.1 unnamed protein product [Parascedosporium putredinis]